MLRLCLLFLATLACAPNVQLEEEPPSDATPESRDRTTWLATVRAQAEAGSYRFVADGLQFRATNRSHSLIMRTEGPNVAVTRGDRTVTLKVVKWGAESALVSAANPSWAAGTCVASGAVDPAGECVRRLAGERAGLTEWWENGPGGLEQGFQVDRPAGHGDLLVDMAIDGAAVTLGAADMALLTLPDGSTLRYDGLVAVDANGRALPARMEPREEGLRLRVDTRGAAWPVEIDPVITSWWSILGEEASTHLGFAMDGVGDVNGDGWDDILVGGYGADEAWLYYGSATGPGTTPDWTGASEDKYWGSYGYAVAGLGDVNGDGYADFAVGAPEGGSGAGGLVHVYIGSPSGPSTYAHRRLQADVAGAEFGSAVDGAGDVNGDGYDDVVVGARQYENEEASLGAAWVYLGSAGGVSTTAAWNVEATTDRDQLGTKVAGLGDVDGDGFDDIAIAAPRYRTTESSAGAVFVHLGGPAGPATTASWIYLGAQATGLLGMGLVAPGDIDGDGYADLLAGEPGYEAIDRAEGRLLLFSGSPTGLSTLPTWTLEATRAVNEIGVAMAGGDVNGDGYADVMVGDPKESEYAGAVHVFHGSPAGLPATMSATIEQRSGGSLGAVLALAGDTNGDGYSELLMGAPDVGMEEQGQVRLAFGSATVPAERVSYTWSITGDYPGIKVADAGDLDGDGYGDVAVTSQDMFEAITHVYVFHGSVTGLGAVANSSFTGEYYFGDVVASAGDVDGDGDDELLITNREATNRFIAEGSVWLYYGTPTGVSAASVVRLDGGQGSAHFGGSAASAGDVNGDGYDDVIVGASFYDDGTPGEGAALVYHGGAAGLDTTADWSLGSDATDAFWASTVSSAGDVNGDGYADVLVGANRWDGSRNDQGAVFLVLGSASGLGATPAWSVLGGGKWDQCGQGLGVGDLNADGYDDIALPCMEWGRLAPGGPQGRVQVWHGGPSGPGTSADWTVEGLGTYDQVGYAAAGLGDLDGDGDDELAVGAPNMDDTFEDQGAVWVYLGDPSGLASIPELTFQEDSFRPAFGMTLSGTSDVDGDGWRELLVGAVYIETAYLFEFVDADHDGAFGWLDCDDTRDDRYPEAVEIWYDGVDQDCDGRDDDRDGDGLPHAEDCDDEDASVGACDTGADDTGTVDTGEQGTQGDDKVGEGGCGCANGGPAAGFGALLAAAAVVVVRRRRLPNLARHVAGGS